MIQLTLSVLLQAAALTAADQDYATAYQQTVEIGPPLVVLIGADWCPGCRQMKYSVDSSSGEDGRTEKSGLRLRQHRPAKRTGRQADAGGSIPQLVMFHKTDEAGSVSS